MASRWTLSWTEPPFRKRASRSPLHRLLLITWTDPQRNTDWSSFKEKRTDLPLLHLSKSLNHPLLYQAQWCGCPSDAVVFRQSFFSDAIELKPHFMCSNFSFLHANASSSRMLDHPPPSSRMVRLHFFFSKVWMFRFFSKVRCTFSFLRCGWTSTSHLSTANCAPSPKKLKFQSLLHVLKISFHTLNDPKNRASLISSKALSSLLSNGAVAPFFFKVWLHLHFLFSAANHPPSHRKPNLSSFFLSSLFSVLPLEIPQWCGCPFFFFFPFLSILTL